MHRSDRRTFLRTQEVPLDPIIVDPVDHVRIARLLPDTAEALALLHDDAAFRAQLLPDDHRAGQGPHRRTGCRPPRRPLSVPLSRELPALRSAGLLAPIRRRDVEEYMDLFKVLKTEDKSRLIGNAIPTNKRMRPPPPCELAPPPEIAQRSGGWRFFTTVDVRHMFYTFSLSPAVAAWFAIHDRDGTVEAFSRMPMGWTYAMYIAQRVSSAIARWVMQRVPGTSVEAYVDGWILRAHSTAVSQRVTAALLCLLLYLHVPVNWPKSTLTPSTTAEFVGVEHDSDRQGYRVLTSWQHELTEWYAERAGRRWTWRDVLVYAGCVTWVWYVRGDPMAELRAVFDLVGWAVATAKSTWDDACPFTPTAEHDRFMAHATADVWVPYRATGGQRTFAETDATPHQYGHVFTSAVRDVLATCGGRFIEPLAIHLAETLGAVITISHAAVVTPDTRLVLGIDNEVARSVLRKGHSPVPALNALALAGHRAARDGGLVVVPYRVNTHRNLADAPSRWSALEYRRWLLEGTPCAACPNLVSHPPFPPA